MAEKYIPYLRSEDMMKTGILREKHKIVYLIWSIVGYIKIITTYVHRPNM